MLLSMSTLWLARRFARGGKITCVDMVPQGVLEPIALAVPAVECECLVFLVGEGDEHEQSARHVASSTSDNARFRSGGCDSKSTSLLSLFAMST